MIEIEGNLLESEEWDIAVHNCNLYKTFGAGIALQIKEKWPEVFKADLESGGEEKFGGFTKATLPDNRTFYNIYGMHNSYGNKYNGIHNPILNKPCNYDGFYNGLYRVCEDATRLRTDLLVGCPKYIGCGLAGGRWTVIKAILKDIESLFDIDFMIFDYDSSLKTVTQ